MSFRKQMKREFGIVLTKHLPNRLKRRLGRAIRKGEIDKKLFQAGDFAHCRIKPSDPPEASRKRNQ